MRVLRISHSAVVTAWRGRERALTDAGVDVHLLSARRWAEGGRDVDLRPVPGEQVRGVRTLGRHPLVFLYDPRPLWRALREPWDVIDIHEEPAALATAEVLLLRALHRIRTPYVLYSAQNLTKRYPVPFRWWERAALHYAGAVSVCNSEAADVLRAKGLTATAHLIGLGVDIDPATADTPHPHDLPTPQTSQTSPSGTSCHDTPGVSGKTFHSSGVRGRPSDRLDPASAADAPSSGVGPASVADPPGPPVRVGYVGRLLAPHKGIDVLLDAVAAHPRLYLALAGAGPHEPTVRGRAAAPDLAGRVVLHGHLSGDALATFYRGIDVLAVPSVPTPGWSEQFGRVAVEAMAHGVPVVASLTGALPDVVADAGTLVPPGDPVALADALLAVADRLGLAHRMRTAGLARAQQYTWPAIADAYLRLYADARTTTTTVPRPTSDAPHRLAALPRTVPPSGTSCHDTPGVSGKAFHLSAVDRSGSGPALTTDPEVVVVAYGAPDLLTEALAPVVGHLRTTVVDNSGDLRVRAVALAAGARYLDPGANLGFGAAVDVVLADRLSPGADLLLLNPDARIDLAAVHALHRALHADPRLGAVGPAQVDGAGRPTRVRWPFPTPAGAWRQAAGLGVARTGPSFVIGSVLLLRAEALADVGGFDEEFFLYAEETDWQRRALSAGWHTAEVPTVSAHHLGGATSTDPARRDTHFHAAQERYLRKHHGPGGWAGARTAVLLGAVPRTLLPADRGRAARRRLRLYLRGPLRAEAALGDPRAPREDAA